MLYDERHGQVGEGYVEHSTQLKLFIALPILIESCQCAGVDGTMREISRASLARCVPVELGTHTGI